MFDVQQDRRFTTQSAISANITAVHRKSIFIVFAMTINKATSASDDPSINNKISQKHRNLKKFKIHFTLYEVNDTTNLYLEIPQIYGNYMREVFTERCNKDKRNSHKIV